MTRLPPGLTATLVCSAAMTLWPACAIEEQIGEGRLEMRKPTMAECEDIDCKLWPNDVCCEFQSGGDPGGSGCKLCGLECCADLPQNQLLCDYSIYDQYSSGVAGVQVKFNVVGATQTWTATGNTDVAGKVTLSIPGVDPTEVVSWSCAPTLGLTGWPYNAVLSHQVTNLMSASYVSVRDDVHKYTNAVSTNGLSFGAGWGQGSGELFQSGAYDKIIVIPESFDFLQNTPKRRSFLSMWTEINDQSITPQVGQGLLKKFYQLGYDVWLFKPTATGENLHEQAAELAQLVQIARSYNGGTASKLVLAGFSLGGLVSRIAMTRWQHDPAWRASLGLGAAPPVDLIVYADAPLRGSRANDNLARLMHEHSDPAAANYDSCAAAQMMVNYCYSKDYCDRFQSGTDDNWYDCVPGQSSTWAKGSRHTNFMETGFAIHIQPGQVCANEPGLRSIGPNNGYTTNIPTIGLSNGRRDEQNTCYRNADGLGRDWRVYGSTNLDLCPYFSANQAPVARNHGDRFYKVQASLLGIDWDMDGFFHCEDSLPGSRSPFMATALQSIATGGDYDWYGIPVFSIDGVELTGSPTFMPTESALDVDAPFWTPWGDAHGVGPTWWNWFNGFHGAMYDCGNTWLLYHIGQAMGDATDPATVSQCDPQDR